MNNENHEEGVEAIWEKYPWTKPKDPEENRKRLAAVRVVETKPLDSGYFYAPYIPIIKTPVVLDPEVFRPRKGILTRYGKKLLKEGAEYYSQKVIKGDEDVAPPPSGQG